MTVAAVLPALEFVEAHLRSDVGVADMADAAGYSLYHFSRLFNRVVGHTPYDYLMRRRLSEAARELVEGEERIIDVAFDYRFNNPETFSRAFKRVFGVQPSQYRLGERSRGDAFLPPLTKGYLEHINRGDYLRPALEEREGVRLAGLMTLIKDEPGDVARLWRLLDVELGGTAPAGRYYGIASRPRAPGEGYFYFAGVEVGGDPVRGPNLVVRALPSARYARFVHKGPRERRELTLGYIRHTWIPRSGHALAYPMEIELYVELPRRFGDEEAETPLLVPL